MEREKPSFANSEGRHPLGGLARILISVGLTALIGYLLYRQVPDWRQSLRVMFQANSFWLVLTLGCVAAHMLLRAVRWGVLLRSAKPNISLRNLFSMTLVKYTVNVVPPRTGEVAASMVLAKKEGISAATVIAASVFERVLDTITVLAVFGSYLVLYGQHLVPESGQGKEIILSIRNYSIKGLIVAAFGLAVLFFLLRGKDWITRIPLRIRGPLLHFMDGFRSLQNHRAALQVVLLSFAIWLVIFMQTWCMVLAYLETFPLAGAMLLLGLTVLGVSIPTPGGVGGYQYFMTLGLTNFFAPYLTSQDPYSQAAGISNGCYLITMLPVMVAGLIMLNKEGLSLGRASRLKESSQETAAFPVLSRPDALPDSE
jgi:glycosyltransferase 2 family protein